MGGGMGRKIDSQCPLLCEFRPKKMVSPSRKDGLVVKETNVLRINLRQNAAAAGVSDVVVQDGPEFQDCTDCTFFGRRLLLLLDAACEKQERFGKVQHLNSLAAVNLLKRANIILGR